MEITDIRIKLIQEPNDRLKAVCSITLGDAFVVRDLKVVEGTQGLFVAMPSRKLTVHCPKCRSKNHLRARFCNDCGGKLPAVDASPESDGRSRLHRDIAHPINSEFREVVQAKVLERYEAERAEADATRASSDEEETPKMTQQSTAEVEAVSEEPQTSAAGEDASDAPPEEPSASRETEEAPASSDAAEAATPSEDGEGSTVSDDAEGDASSDDAEADTASDGDESGFKTSDYNSLIAGLKPGGGGGKRREDKTGERPARAPKPQDRKPRGRRDRTRSDAKRDSAPAAAKTDDKPVEKPVEAAPQSTPPPARSPRSTAPPDDEEPAFGAGIL